MDFMESYIEKIKKKTASQEFKLIKGSRGIKRGKEAEGKGETEREDKQKSCL